MVDSVEEALDQLDDIVDRSTVIPMTNGKIFVDIDELKDLIDSIRLYLPQEIKKARLIVDQEEEIIADAKAKSEETIRKADNRVRVLLAEDNIVKQAKAEADRIVKSAEDRANEVMKAATTYSDNLFKESEQTINESLDKMNEIEKRIKESRIKIRNSKWGRITNG